MRGPKEGAKTTYKLDPEERAATNPDRLLQVLGDDDGRERNDQGRGRQLQDSLLKLEREIGNAWQRGPKGIVRAHIGHLSQPNGAKGERIGTVVSVLDWRLGGHKGSQTMTSVEVLL